MVVAVHEDARLAEVVGDEQRRTRGRATRAALGSARGRDDARRTSRGRARVRAAAAPRRRAAARLRARRAASGSARPSRRRRASAPTSHRARDANVVVPRSVSSRKPRARSAARTRGCMDARLLQQPRDVHERPAIFVRRRRVHGDQRDGVRRTGPARRRRYAKVAPETGIGGRDCERECRQLHGVVQPGAQFVRASIGRSVDRG